MLVNDEQQWAIGREEMEMKDSDWFIPSCKVRAAVFISVCIRDGNGIELRGIRPINDNQLYFVQNWGQQYGAANHTLPGILNQAFLLIFHRIYDVARDKKINNTFITC